MSTTTDVAPRSRRADAVRNIEAIVDAAEHVLARDPDASMGDIAAEAGLGRVTVYGHFASRNELIEVVVRRVLSSANETLREVDLSGDPADALSRLVEATWTLIERSGRLLVAANKALPAPLLRELHCGELEGRVRRLIVDGRASSAFRDDLPVDWLVATLHAIVHAAAEEVDGGRLEGNGAARVITATMHGIYTSPGRVR